MSRRIIWAILILASLVACAYIGSALIERSARRAATNNGAIRDFSEFTSDQLNRDVRIRVPLGSSRAFVEGFLTGEGMEFSYDSSHNLILANAPCLKGSGIVIESLEFTFQFDGNANLTSIKSQINLTGP